MGDAARLYDQVAADLRALITRGALRPGDRLPSVRKTARDRVVSISTVLAAYLQLENEGLVETRPKSGHFVRRRDTLPPAHRPRLVAVPSRPSVFEGVRALLDSLRDPAVVPLGSAVPGIDLLPIRALNRTLATLAREATTAGAHYESVAGVATLRRQLARRSATWGAPLPEDEFIPTVGATEALHIALGAVARPGDTVVVASPTYFGVLQLFESMGLRALDVPCSPESGLDLDALESTLRASSARAVVCSPNYDNPLGALMPDDRKERLVRMCARHDVPLVEDDVYGDLGFDGARPRPAKAFDTTGHVLLVGSISKTLAPGYRLGWLVAGRYQRAVEQRKRSTTLATPTLPQMAVAEYLAKGGYDRHLRTMRARLAQQVQRFREEIALRFPAGTRVSQPRGGFVLWVELPRSVDALRLQAEALARGVSIAPGPIFSARGRFGSCVRISCGFPWSTRIETALRLVGDLAATQVAEVPVRRARDTSA